MFISVKAITRIILIILFMFLLVDLDKNISPNIRAMIDDLDWLKMRLIVMSTSGNIFIFFELKITGIDKTIKSDIYE